MPLELLKPLEVVQLLGEATLLPLPGTDFRVE
jgi:hypothetical protein